MVKRVETWPRELSDYLSERKKIPFEWGKNDCLLFVAYGVARLTGKIFYKEYEGYNDEAGALDVLKLHGGVEGIINKHLGPGNRNVLTARRGDVGVAKMPEITAGLIDDSGQFLVVVTPAGIRRVPLAKVWRVWSY